MCGCISIIPNELTKTIKLPLGFYFAEVPKLTSNEQRKSILRGPGMDSENRKQNMLDLGFTEEQIQKLQDFAPKSGLGDVNENQEELMKNFFIDAKNMVPDEEKEKMVHFLVDEILSIFTKISLWLFLAVFKLEKFLYQ